MSHTDKSAGYWQGVIKGPVGLSECIKKQKDILAYFDQVEKLKSEVGHQALMVEKDNSRFFCKAFQERGLRAKLRVKVLGCRAKISHQSSLAFKDIVGLTPASFGYLQQQSADGWLSYHFCEYIKSADTLEVFLSGMPDNEKLKGILQQLTQALADLHAAGYVHGDLKMRNILIDAERVMFVDLDGFGKFSVSRRPQKDIARVVVGLAEAGVDMRLLAGLFSDYCRCRKIDRNEFLKQLDPIISRLQARHLDQYGRKIRQITL